jgi:DNA-binding NarL/FixJ family response regulator
MVTVKRLTPRQRQVVILLSEGLSCPQIAVRMSVRVKTVRAHIYAISRLLDAAEHSLPAMRRIKLNAKLLLAA